jgi:hypothetical protein
MKALEVVFVLSVKARLQPRLVELLCSLGVEPRCLQDAESRCTTVVGFGFARHLIYCCEPESGLPHRSVLVTVERGQES